MTKLFLDKLNIWIATDDMNKFYKSSEWMHVRSVYLKKRNYECELCKLKNKVETADTVHHAFYVRRYPQYALDERVGQKQNLFALCRECHYEVHHKSTIPERW